MISYLSSIWKWITDLGVSDKHKAENELIRSYNIMSIITSIGGLIVIAYSQTIEVSIIYLSAVIYLTSIYLLVLICNFFKKIYLSRYIVSIGSPIWCSVGYYFVGGYFCQGAGLISSMAITYVAFQNQEKTKNALLLYHVITFVFAMFLVNQYGPLFNEYDFPFDEYIVLLGGLGWCFIMLFTFNKDRTQLLNNLTVNNEELKNTSEELERFSYIASHDLKSPLRTIISFIGLIERDIVNKDFENIEENLGFVKSGAEQMNFLVQDILELSKLNNFEYTKRSMVDLHEIYKKAHQNLINDIGEKEAKVKCENLPTFYCNELEFLLLFQNFIQNAIKYNESKPPEITISSFQKNNKLHLLFKDNGIGISEEYHLQIFEYFKRLHTSEKYQGTGLGLGLCNKIIKSYKGEIKVISEIDQGSTFEITFPLESM